MTANHNSNFKVGGGEGKQWHLLGKVKRCVRVELLDRTNQKWLTQYYSGLVFCSQVFRNGCLNLKCPGINQISLTVVERPCCCSLFGCLCGHCLNFQVCRLVCLFNRYSSILWLVNHLQSVLVGAFSLYAVDHHLGIKLDNPMWRQHPYCHRLYQRIVSFPGDWYADKYLALLNLWTSSNLFQF